MFMLTTFEDSIRIAPSETNKPRAEAVSAVIEELYFDKVVDGVGLVVTLYDIIDIRGGIVHAGDGGPHYTVKFRVVVFRPFPGEILVGTVVRSSNGGVQVSLGFFDDIHVPEYFLHDPSFFDDARQAWIWKYEEQQLDLEAGDEVRVRVHEVKFRPAPPLQEEGGEAGETAEGTLASPFAPMQIICKTNEDGLGSVTWWQAVDVDMDTDDAA